MLKLSVSMIVKNEESCLEKCLESIKGADEIVIVDTGSTDSTIEIAKRYTNKVYSGEEYLWRDNFAFSRNQSLDKCTGDWILIIDADEVLEEGGILKLRQAIEKTDKSALIFNVVSKNGNSSHNFIRAFKKSSDVYWKGKIHNYLNVTSGERVNISVYYGYSEAHKKDPDRALRILTKVVQEEPQSVREKFYLAREYFYKKDWVTALYWYDEYLRVSKWMPERAEGYLMASRCAWYLKQGDRARQYCLNAINNNANFKEALLFMAEISWEHNAKRWREFAELATNENVLFVRTPEEKNNKYYDELFKKNNDMSRYREIQEEIAKMVGDKSVLDIGCGTGELGKYIEKYSGFDFSEEAVKLAGDKCWVGNAYDKENFKEADIMVATEVFEHLDDLKVIKNIPQGQEVIFSVPSFTDPSHIRIFTEESMRERYKDYFDIKSVTRFNWHDKWTKGEDTPSYILLVEAIKL
jgi:glycosyltransferase involved in cell wall biosynthesis